MDPNRMKAMDEARPVLTISWKIHAPRNVAATPRTADEIMCVMGEVTLIERRLAMLIVNPRMPVKAVPQRNFLSVLIDPGSLTNSSTPKNNFKTSGPSPARMTTGTIKIEHIAFWYQERSSALPLTIFKLRLMTTECKAVMTELATPKQTPRGETCVPSKKTPTKNPTDTMAQDSNMRRDGLACKTK